MKTCLNRRSFLKQTALTAGVLSTAPFNVLHAANAGEKVRVAQIGCGGRGMNHLNSTLNEELVAIVDVDEKRHAAVKKWFGDKQRPADHVQIFADYRKMFDKLGKQIDAVFIATPNHQHALPALIAMQLGRQTVSWMGSSSGEKWPTRWRLCRSHQAR